MGGGGRWVALVEEEVKRGLAPSHDGADVSFSLPFWCPLDAAELERHWVSGRCGSTARACPDGHGHDRRRIGGVGKAACMPPVGATFALEERGAGGLVAGALVARVARAGHVLIIEFWVADVVEDI